MSMFEMLTAKMAEALENGETDPKYFARLALHTLREPTEAMCWKGADAEAAPCEEESSNPIGFFTAKECWGLMIDAAG